MKYTKEEIRKLIAVQIASIHELPFSNEIFEKELYKAGDNCIQDLFFQDLHNTAIYQEIVDADGSSCLWSSQTTDNDDYFTYFTKISGNKNYDILKSWQYTELGYLIDLVIDDFMKVQDGVGNIKSEHDFWTPAIDFMTDNLSHDYEEKFIKYCKRQGFNYNEIMFFREMIQNAFSYRMSTVVIRLNAKEQNKKESTNGLPNRDYTC